MQSQWQSLLDNVKLHSANIQKAFAAASLFVKQNCETKAMEDIHRADLREAYQGSYNTFKKYWSDGLRLTVTQLKLVIKGKAGADQVDAWLGRKVRGGKSRKHRSGGKRQQVTTIARAWFKSNISTKRQGQLVLAELKRYVASL